MSPAVRVRFFLGNNLLKILVLLLGVFTWCAVGSSQSRGTGSYDLPLDEVLRLNQEFHDAMYGLSFNYPVGWKVLGGYRRDWNDPRENSLVLTPDARSKLAVKVSYQMFSPIVPAPEPGPMEVFLRRLAQQSQDSYVEDGTKDYKNVPGSFAFAEFLGHAVLKNSATFTKSRKPWAEYYIRFFGSRGFVVFVVNGPAAEVQSAKGAVDRMAASIRGSLVDAEEVYQDTFDWLLNGK